MNLETPQDLKHELTPSSKRGQAKQLACRPHQTHLSFFTAVEFYRQRKLPDIPRKSPIHTGLDRVTERSRRTSCMGFALFAPLFSFASGRAIPSGRRPQNQPISFVTDHSIRELAPGARSPSNTTPPTNTTLTHPATRLATRMTWPIIPYSQQGWHLLSSNKKTRSFRFFFFARMMSV
jgi:hypothetical protein